MPELREELHDCEIGDIILDNKVDALPSCCRLFAHGRWDPPLRRWDDADYVFPPQPIIEFVRAIATFPDSTAKVRVWKRIC